MESFYCRYWVEQGNKYFPQNLAVKRLKVKMGDSLNGGGSVVSSLQSSAETSPKTNQDNDGLWTPNVTLNGASRYAEGLNTSLATSTPNARYITPATFIMVFA